MSRLGKLKSTVSRLATNLRGWKSRRRLLIIESDDWGAIRMPSRRAWERLLASGIRVDRSRYDSLDCLENRNDFQALMNVIQAHSDANGRSATFTFNTVMGNPNFEAIERDDFERFYHQPLFESYRYYHGEDLEDDWRDAMRARLIRPQFHAREHLNSPLWMAELKAGHKETRLAFREGFYGLKTRIGFSSQQSYLAAHWPDLPEHLGAIEQIIEDGLDQFEETFGFPSLTFIGCNYIWPEALEGRLAQRGVKLLQTQRGHVEPHPREPGRTRIRRHYTGQSNRHGQRYSVRNVLFEPYLDESADWVTRAMKEVAQAFQCGKPAIVCTHRINYVSGMDRDHRDRNLKQLDDLLGRLTRRWPDLEFITSEELSTIMQVGQ